MAPRVLFRSLLMLGLISPMMPAWAQDLLLSPPMLTLTPASKAQQSPSPHVVAAPIMVDVRPQSAGRWSRLNDEQRWMFSISVPGAQFLSLGFAQAVLPAGARLYLVSDQQTVEIDRAHIFKGQLWTRIVPGNQLQLLATLPAGLPRDALQLHLTQVGYGLREILRRGGPPGRKDKDRDAEADCRVDVVCPQGESLQQQSRAVARVLIGGRSVCTGTLLNNTAADGKPYFLTAAHCLSSEAEAATTVFYWNYENSLCGQSDATLDQVTHGAHLRATSGGEPGKTAVGRADFTLLELAQLPPAEFAVYLSGWDNRAPAPIGASTIHHPMGQVKSLSQVDGATQISAYKQPPGSLLSQLSPTHIRVPEWTLGETQHGSSGAGLWNRQGHLVGHLTGGDSDCGESGADWFGRFNRAWFDQPGLASSVASYLDPDNTGVEVLDGLDPYQQARIADANLNKAQRLGPPWLYRPLTLRR